VPSSLTSPHALWALLERKDIDAVIVATIDNHKG
jgi:hypothetical protein